MGAGSFGFVGEFWGGFGGRFYYLLFEGLNGILKKLCVVVFLGCFLLAKGAKNGPFYILCSSSINVLQLKSVIAQFFLKWVLV